MLWRDLRARLRDRSALIVGVLAPLALMYVLSLMMGGYDRTKLDVGFAAIGESPVATAIRDDALRSLEDDGTLTVTERSSRDELIQAITDGDIKSAVVVTAGRPAAIEVLSGNDSAVSSAVLDAVSSRAAGVSDAVGRVVAAETALGGQPGDVAALSERVAAAPPIVTVVDAGESAGGITPKTAVAAGMATFFLFFTVQFGLLGLLEERRIGVLRRVLAGPVAPWKVLLAKVGVSFVLGILSMTVLIVAARWMVAARWGPPLGVAVLVVCGVLAAVSTVTLVVGAVRNAEQAANLQGMVALILGLMGGSFFSMYAAGGVARVLTKLTPHFWFHEGLIQISAGRSWTGALRPAAMMLIFAAAVGIPGLLLARRTVRP